MMELDDRITITASVMLGRPVIRGTRNPVELLLRKLGEGATVDDLLDAFPGLTRADMHAALTCQGWRVVCDAPDHACTHACIDGHASPA